MATLVTGSKRFACNYGSAKEGLERQVDAENWHGRRSGGMVAVVKSSSVMIETLENNAHGTV